MNAREARKKTIKLIEESNAIIISDIHLCIDSAVKDKKLECTYYKGMNESTIGYFKDLGYQVEQVQTGINEDGYLIKW